MHWISVDYGFQCKKQHEIMLKNGAICVKTYRHLRQIILPFASSYEVKSMSLCGELTEMTTKEDKNKRADRQKWPHIRAESRFLFLFGGVLRC